MKRASRFVTACGSRCYPPRKHFPKRCSTTACCRNQMLQGGITSVSERSNPSLGWDSIGKHGISHQCTRPFSRSLTRKPKVSSRQSAMPSLTIARSNFLSVFRGGKPSKALIHLRWIDGPVGRPRVGSPEVDLHCCEGLSDELASFPVAVPSGRRALRASFMPRGRLGGGESDFRITQAGRQPQAATRPNFCKPTNRATNRRRRNRSPWPIAATCSTHRR